MLPPTFIPPYFILITNLLDLHRDVKIWRAMVWSRAHVEATSLSSATVNSVNMTIRQSSFKSSKLRAILLSGGFCECDKMKYVLEFRLVINCFGDFDIRSPRRTFNQYSYRFNCCLSRRKSSEISCIYKPCFLLTFHSEIC